MSFFTVTMVERIEKIERTIAWLGNLRRLLPRWEKSASHFASFAILGCVMIALRHMPCKSLFGQPLGLGQGSPMLR